MRYLQTYGPALIDRGYLITAIRPGSKAPAIKDWLNHPLTAADLTRYPGYGIGVLCGKGPAPVIGLDLDIDDPDIVASLRAWCIRHIGPAPARTGRAPRVLLVYRADAPGWSKARSARFAGCGQIEALNEGQQFVAYHTHPDTGKPFTWDADPPGAADLTPITQAQVSALIQEFETLAGLLGYERDTPGTGAPHAAVDASDPLDTYQPTVGLTLADAKEYLDALDPTEYETWINAGMALHHEFSGAQEAYEMWDTWSAPAPNYKGPRDTAARWASFGRNTRMQTTARWLLKMGRQAREQQARESKRSAVAEFRARIAACDDSIDLVNVLAPQAADLAGRDLAVRAELTGLIKARFKDLTGTTLPAADARAATAGSRPVAQPPAGQVLRARTEFGNAERMLDKYGAGLMYVPELECWHIWTGAHWRKAAQVELEHLAKETIQALPLEAQRIEGDGERADFFKFCAASQKAAMVRNVVTLAQSDARVVSRVHTLDADRRYLCTANGAIDLQTGRLCDPDPDMRLTMTTGVDYDPDATCPLFEQTLSEVFFYDPEAIGFFQRLVGYALTGNPREDVLVIPFGCGSNGKSTVLNAVRRALGDYARTAGAETFLTDAAKGAAAGGGAREDILRLRGARFVYVTEAEEGHELRESMVKSMTGGEPLPVRGVYSRHTVEVQPTWVAFMPTNHRPIIKGDDHAIWRRLLMLPFTRNFDTDPDIRKDPQRREKLPAEAPGILAWCVRGALEYQRKGLRPPASVKQSGAEYRSSMDLLAEWLDDCCEQHADYAESNAVLWESWEAYARMRGDLRYIPSMRALGRRLDTRGMRQVRNSMGIKGRGWAGLRVK